MEKDFREQRWNVDKYFFSPVKTDNATREVKWRSELILRSQDKLLEGMQTENFSL